MRAHLVRVSSVLPHARVLPAVLLPLRRDAQDPADCVAAAACWFCGGNSQSLGLWFRTAAGRLAAERRRRQKRDGAAARQELGKPVGRHEPEG
jgi:hypothetical protein